MKALDWLKFVGWYVMGALLVLSIGYLFGRPLFGAPIQPIVVFLAAGAAARGSGPAYPLAGRPTLTIMAALMALGGLAVVFGQATVGWAFGWVEALVYAAAAAVFYPLLFNWAARRKANAAALATDAGT